MTMIAYDWELDVERGPNWLLVKVGTPPGKSWEMLPLADRLRSLMEEHLTYRLLLELGEIERLSSKLIGELLSLDQWIRARQGVMRLCGLSPHKAEVLRHCRLDGLFPIYRDRLEAVLGSHRAGHPR